MLLLFTFDVEQALTYVFSPENQNKSELRLFKASTLLKALKQAKNIPCQSYTAEEYDRVAEYYKSLIRMLDQLQDQPYFHTLDLQREFREFEDLANGESLLNENDRFHIKTNAAIKGCLNEIEVIRNRMVLESMSALRKNDPQLTSNLHESKSFFGYCHSKLSESLKQGNVRSDLLNLPDVKRIINNHYFACRRQYFTEQQTLNFDKSIAEIIFCDALTSTINVVAVNMYRDSSWVAKAWWNKGLSPLFEKVGIEQIGMLIYGGQVLRIQNDSNLYRSTEKWTMLRKYCVAALLPFCTDRCKAQLKKEHPFIADVVDGIEILDMKKISFKNNDNNNDDDNDNKKIVSANLRR